MKKIFLVLLILLSGTGTLLAQSCDFTPNVIVTDSLCNLTDTLQNSNTTLTARDKIVFTPGFHVGATELHNHAFIAHTDHSVVNHLVNYITEPVNGSTRVLDKENCIPGTIGGSIDVSSGGAATYQLPIQMTPGTHGMQPSLSIVYNSQSGNGLLGYGWHLAGLSSISRTSKNPYYDGIYNAVTLTTNDALVLDGARLINTSENVYSPENNPYVRVVYNGTCFTVTTQDGIITEYGNTIDSRVQPSDCSVPLSWRINKITDPEGNYIQFVYTGDNSTGEYRISEINYTGNSNAGLEPYNSVQFLYDLRTDKNTVYVAGYPITQSVLLTGIRVICEDVVAKEYTFTYYKDENSPDQYSKLNQIDFTADGITYNPTIINWGEVSNYTIQTVNSPWYAHVDNAIYLGDFNDDGRKDVVNYLMGDRKITIDMKQPNGAFVTYTINLPPEHESYNYQDPPDYSISVSDSYNLQDLSIADWNNDGQDELSLHYIDSEEIEYNPLPHSDPNYAYHHFEYSAYDKINTYAFSNESFIFSGTNEIVVGASPNPLQDMDTCKYYYGDFNYDGKTDRLTIKNRELFHCTDITGTSVANLPVITAIEDIKNVDFDGDGQTEFLTLTNDGTPHIWKYNGTTFIDIYTPGTVAKFGEPEDLYTGDFNGDGKTDLIILLDNKYEHFLISDGKSFLKKDIFGGSYYSRPMMVDDINNDGKSDIIEANGGHLVLYITIGTKGEYIQCNKDFPVLEMSSYICSGHENSFTFYAADMNLDGQKEIIYGFRNNSYENGTWQCIDSTIHIVTINEKFDSPLYVNSITNGLNNTSTFTYSVYNDNREFSSTFPRPGFPIKLFRGPRLLASNLQTVNGYSTWQNVNYTYGDAYLHEQGLGFLGYKNVIIDNQLNHLVSTSSYSFTIPGNTSVYYPWLSTASVTKNNIPIASSSNTLSAMGGNISQKLFVPIVTSSTSNDHLRNNSITNAIVTFNAITGRIEKKTSATSDGWSTETQSDFATISNNVSRLTQTILKKMKGTDIYYDTVAYTYDTQKPLRLVSQKEHGLITTSYTAFNPYGNPIAISITTNSGTRSSSCTYDAKGRFVLTGTNAAGYTSSAVYRKTDGAMLTATDPNLLTTKYSYTPQGGSLISTITNPDLTTSTSTLAWDNTGNGMYSMHNLAPNGSNSITFYNAGGQKVRENVSGYKDAVLSTTYAYNSDGSLYFLVPPPGNSLTTYNYYPDGRVHTVTGHNLNMQYNYSGSAVTVTDNISGTTQTQYSDALGNVTNVNGTMGTVTYQYYASGKVKQLTAVDNTTAMTYDVFGNQLSLTDPDAGTTNYQYNGFGEITYQEDAKNQIINCTYDNAGRITTKTGNNINISYNYNETPGRLGLLQSVTRNGISETYEYDNLCRPVTVTTAGDGKTFVTTNEYNNKGQVSYVHYPTGLSLMYDYDNTGNLQKIYNAANTTTPLWSGDVRNNRNQWTDYTFGNGKTTTLNYDNNYRIESMITPGVQSLGFTFNDKGQLTNRTEGSLSEGFSYDALNRLTSATLAGQTPVSWQTQYTGNGNINSTTLAGNFTYLPGKPHAVQTVSGPANMDPSPQIITTSSFTADNKIQEMENDNYKNTFTYGPSGERFKVNHYQDDVLTSSKIYAGNSEFVLNASGNITTSRTFIYAPTGICAVYEKDAQNNATMNYVYTDYLGSWLKITNEAGTVTDRYSYDAWGRPRDPDTWQLEPIDITNALANLNAMQPRFDRGYTGHEYMAGFGLINMNGRLYDPYLQRFLSPDNVVQSPGNAQNYNRYSYCMNNPLMYVDPTGWNMYYPNGYDGGIVGGGGGAGSMEDDPYWVCSGDGASFGGSTSGTEYWNSLYYERDAGRLGYTYTGNSTYIDNYTGSEVSFDEVYNKYVLPKSQFSIIPSSSSKAYSFTATLLEYVNAGFSIDLQLADNGQINVRTPSENSWGIISEGYFSNADIRLAIAEAAGQRGTTGLPENDFIKYSVAGTSVWAETIQTGFDVARKLQPTVSTWIKGAKVLGKTSNFLGGVSITYDFATGTANSSTVANATVMVAGSAIVFFGGVALAPWVAAGGVAYGIISISGGDEWLNRNLDISQYINIYKPSNP